MMNLEIRTVADNTTDEERIVMYALPFIGFIMMGM